TTQTKLLAQGRKTPDRKAQGRKTPDRKAPGRKAQGRKAPGRKAQGRKAQGRKTPGRKAQGRKAPGRKAQGRKAQGRKAQGRKAPGRKFNLRTIFFPFEARGGPTCTRYEMTDSSRAGATLSSRKVHRSWVGIRVSPLWVWNLVVERY
uniref:Uncharacterized protein n=1 Tax=Paramormyrops kingsleyae TaxID=1676925 RepID=A0A3B3SVT0_9TELE